MPAACVAIVHYGARSRMAWRLIIRGRTKARSRVPLSKNKNILMKKLTQTCIGAFLLKCAATCLATELTAIPGPDDQGGMIMPMVTLTGTTVNVSFNPAATPVLAGLGTWSPGDTFPNSASWNSLLDPVDGQGALFNNQYGFMFMANPMMGMDNVPTGKSLGIRLLARNSSLLESWNYVNGQNRFDEVFANVGDQVLWNGSMWHNYFTLPNSAAPGIYTASFEIFIADTTFTAGTGFADYTAGALSAAQDTGYRPVTVNYSWQVVPEPSVSLLLVAGASGFLFFRKRRVA